MTDAQLTTLTRIIAGYEGFSNKAYPDPKGHPTSRSIGYGILTIDKSNTITPNGKKIQTKNGIVSDAEFRTKINDGTLTVTPAYAQELLQQDVASRIEVAKTKFTQWDLLPFKVQVAVINIFYQYGTESFPNTMQQIKNGHYENAAKYFLIQQYLFNNRNSNAAYRGFYNARLLLESASNYESDLKVKYGF